MSTPETTEAGWLQSFLDLLPPGKLFDLVRSGGSRLTQIVDGLTPEFNRVSNVLNDLWRQSDPREALDTTDPPKTLINPHGYDTIALLPDFERNYGLPDPCIGAPATNDERRAILYAKWIANGGQTAAYFIEVAEGLLGAGFTVTITSPYLLGGWTPLSTPIYPFLTQSAFYSWTMDVTPVPTAAQQTALECLINRFKPAHTAAYFTYTP